MENSLSLLTAPVAYLIYQSHARKQNDGEDSRAC